MKQAATVLDGHSRYWGTSVGFFMSYEMEENMKSVLDLSDIKELFSELSDEQKRSFGRHIATAAKRQNSMVVYYYADYCELMCDCASIDLAEEAILYLLSMEEADRLITDCNNWFFWNIVSMETSTNRAAFI